MRLGITKIFYFEMAHAIHGYAGACKNMHGHSYELRVTVASGEKGDACIPAPGFIVDFKALKALVKAAVVDVLDHKLVLSRAWLAGAPSFPSQENLFIWDAEPTAENILVYAQKAIREKLPVGLKLTALKLYETKDSYAEWNDDGD